MKSLLIILSIAFSNALIPAHDVAIAMFHITESGNDIKIDITFDLEDLTESLFTVSKEINKDKLQDYLDQNTSFLFNNKSSTFEIMEINIVRDHIKIKGSFDRSSKNVKGLKIRNTCLINVSKHSNIIQVDLNNQSKDYRMHKGRTEIELKY